MIFNPGDSAVSLGLSAQCGPQSKAIFASDGKVKIQYSLHVNL